MSSATNPVSYPYKDTEISDKSKVHAKTAKIHAKIRKEHF